MTIASLVAIFLFLWQQAGPIVQLLIATSPTHWQLASYITEYLIQKRQQTSTGKYTKQDTPPQRRLKRVLAHC